MVQGQFTAISGSVVDQRISEPARGSIDQTVIEVTLQMDANGEAQASIPFVSGVPTQYAVRHSGVHAPAASLTLGIVGTVGRIAAIPSPILEPTAVTGDVLPTGYGSAFNVAGPLRVAVQSSSTNSGKRITVVVFVQPFAIVVIA